MEALVDCFGEWTGPGMGPEAVETGAAAPQEVTERDAAPGCATLRELASVPKAALEAVFGEGLGRRIWMGGRQFRKRDGAGSRCDAQDGEGVVVGREPTARRMREPVVEEDIVRGMIGYVSGQAETTLRECGREAKAIGLRIEYADGMSLIERATLTRATSDAAELLAAAVELFGRRPARNAGVSSVNLTVTSVEAGRVRERVADQESSSVQDAPALVQGMVRREYPTGHARRKTETALCV